MKTSEALGWGVLVVIIIALGIYALLYTHPTLSPFASSTPSSNTSGTGTSGTTGPVTFYCTEGQITATFSANAVQLDLSDGRYFALPEVMSGSGIRYEATTSAGTFESFQSEGSWGQLVQNGNAIYSNCLAAHVTESSGTKTFIDQSNTFSFKYPDAFSIVGTEPGYGTNWMVNATTSGMLLAEVQLPKSAMPNTNFGDAVFTVGVSSDPSALSECLTYNPSGGAASAPTNATIDSLDFVKFTSSDAAAGNRYDTTSYRIIRDNECYALEYTVHYGVLENYPAGTPQFNETTVKNELDAIAKSFQFLQ